MDISFDVFCFYFFDIFYFECEIDEFVFKFNNSFCIIYNIVLDRWCDVFGFFGECMV